MGRRWSWRESWPVLLVTSRIAMWLSRRGGPDARHECLTPCAGRHCWRHAPITGSANQQAGRETTRALPVLTDKTGWDLGT